MTPPRRWSLQHLPPHLLILLSVTLAACATGTPGGVTTSLQKSLTVFAAASLTDAFRELGAVYEVSSGVSVSFNFGASTQLRTQLEQGAAADVFASADQIQMDTARGAGVVRGADIPFARNRLVIITPRNNPAGILRPLDLANPGIKVVTASSEVPIGVYTQNMLDAMSQTEGIGPRFKDAVNANIVSREPNVRQVVAKVQLGEADAAVVYLTDVTPSSAADLMTVTIPDELNTIATYPIALVSTSPQPELGNAFIDLVLSAAGQAILQRWSFTPVGPTALNQQPRPSAPEQAAS